MKQTYKYPHEPFGQTKNVADSRNMFFACRREAPPPIYIFCLRRKICGPIIFCALSHMQMALLEICAGAHAHTLFLNPGIDTSSHSYPYYTLSPVCSKYSAAWPPCVSTTSGFTQLVQQRKFYSAICSVVTPPQYVHWPNLVFRTHDLWSICAHRVCQQSLFTFLFLWSKIYVGMRRFMVCSRSYVYLSGSETAI